MVLDALRPGSERVFTPFARQLARVGITPNMLSAVSLLAAFAAGFAYYLATPESPWWLFAAAALIGLNALMDSVDGILARVTNTSSRLGDLIDHVIDRYADFALLIGLSLSVWVDVRIGVFAIVGTALTSYMGTQAQALGLGRNYRGLLGRADRIALLIIAPLVDLLRILLGLPTIGGFSVLALVVIWIAVAGNLTAVQRIWHAIADLRARSDAEAE